MTIIETERLTLRPMSMDDMPDMFQIYGNEQAMRYIPYEPHNSVEETREHFASRLHLQWAIRLKGQDRVAGAINFIHARVPGMGYIIHPDFWGQGIAAEASRAMIDYAFANFGYDRLELWIDETNKGSRRVAEKLGFEIKARIPATDRFTQTYTYLLVWGMLGSDWQSEDKPASAETLFYSVDPVFKVHDVRATAEYYRDKLGFTIDFLYSDPPTYAGVSRGEWTGNMVNIHFSQLSADIQIQSSAHLHIRVGIGLDALFELYRDRGVTIIEEPQDRPRGLREFVIGDLNGHRLVFARYL